MFVDVVPNRNGDVSEKATAGQTHISMDGKGRAADNIFVERLWRAVKYEEIYLKSCGTMKELKMNLTVYFDFYNDERPHDSLDRMTPTEVYYDLLAEGIAA